MPLSTSTLRAVWSPACRQRHDFEPAYRALDAWLKFHGYRPGYGTGAANCRAITGGTGYSLHAYFDNDDFTFWNGYRIPLKALAVDINPPQNPYARRLITNMPRAMVEAISRVRTNSGHQVWHWGGYFSRFLDPMHYEITCTPAQLATGIRASTLPGGSSTPPTVTGDCMWRIVTFQGDPSAPDDQPDVAATYRCFGGLAELNRRFIARECWHLGTQADVDTWKRRGLVQESTRRSSAEARGVYGTKFYDGPFRNVS